MTLKFFIPFYFIFAFVLVVPQGKPDTTIYDDLGLAQPEVKSLKALKTPELKEQAALEPIILASAITSIQNAYYGSGNGYDRCQCTYYAKSKRPDLPNNLGNADTWVIRARAQGIPTGSAPRAGAIGQRGMHVVYVERVNGDGTIYLSELNYDYNCGFRYRTAPASSFLYIY